MKSSIFINEGRTQVVLTPENEWERSALKVLHQEERSILKTYYAQFNDVQGGWTMFEGENYRGKDQDSLIFVIDKEPNAKR